MSLLPLKPSRRQILKYTLGLAAGAILPVRLLAPVSADVRNGSLLVNIPAGSQLPLKFSVFISIVCDDPDEPYETESLLVTVTTTSILAGYAPLNIAAKDYNKPHWLEFTVTQNPSPILITAEFRHEEEHSEGAEIEEVRLIARIGGLTPWGKELMRNAQDIFNAAAISAAAASVSIGCKGPSHPDPKMIPVCGTLAGLGLGLAIGGLALNRFATDPPDANFTVIAQPVFKQWPHATISQEATDAIKAIQAFWAYGNAAYLSSNRVWGAELAGNRQWQQWQLNAAVDYAKRAGEQLLTFEKNMVAVVRQLSGYSIDTWADHLLLDYQFAFHSGFPYTVPEAYDGLRTLGMTDADLNDYKAQVMGTRMFEWDTGAPLYDFIFPDGLLALMPQLEAIGGYLAALPYVSIRTRNWRRS